MALVAVATPLFTQSRCHMQGLAKVMIGTAMQTMLEVKLVQNLT
jgi:hypothetical protein